MSIQKLSSHILFKSTYGSLMVENYLISPSSHLIMVKNRQRLRLTQLGFIQGLTPSFLSLLIRMPRHRNRLLKRTHSPSLWPNMFVYHLSELNFWSKQEALKIYLLNMFIQLYPCQPILKLTSGRNTAQSSSLLPFLTEGSITKWLSMRLLFCQENTNSSWNHSTASMYWKLLSRLTWLKLSWQSLRLF